MSLQDKITQRVALIEQARSFAAEKGGFKNFTAEEGEQYDKMMNDEAVLSADIKKEEEAERRARDFAAREALLSQPQQRKTESTQVIVTNQNQNKPNVRTVGDIALEKFYRSAGDKTKLDLHEMRALDKALELRSIVQGTDASGGYLNKPVDHRPELIDILNNKVFIRQLCKAYQVQGSDTIEFPKVSANPAAPSQLATETTSISAESTTAFTLVSATPEMMAVEVDVSWKMLQCTSFPILEWVNGKIAYGMAAQQENLFLNGRGHATYYEPIGVFEASATGHIATAQDVSTDNTTTAITSKGLINAFYTMSPNYVDGATWAFHNAAMKQLALLTDGIGQPLWRTGLVAGAPDTLLGKRIDVSAYVPSTFTTGLYVGVLANWQRGYYIADIGGLDISRNPYLKDATSLTCFIARALCTGVPVDDSAFIRVKLA